MNTKQREGILLDGCRVTRRLDLRGFARIRGSLAPWTALVLLLALSAPGFAQWSSPSGRTSSRFGSRLGNSNLDRFGSSDFTRSTPSNVNQRPPSYSPRFGDRAPYSPGLLIPDNRPDNELGRTSLYPGFPEGSNRPRGSDQQSGGATTTKVPTTLRLGFEPTPRKSSRLEATLTHRIARSTWTHALAPIVVTIQDETAILRGRVATPHDRLLLERLVLLEPGIRQVRNEVDVTGESPIAEPALTDPTPSPAAAE